MNHPSFKQIISYCTSGTIVRDDLISKWYNVITEDEIVIKAYYHLIHGWMIKREPQELFKYGYVPISKKVIKWYK